jgi:hypothetical protein
MTILIALITLIMLITLIALPRRQDAQGYQDYQGYQPPWSVTLARPRRVPVPTVATCVRRFCLGASSARGAFDCGDRVCPLRPASPSLGKPMPLTMRTEDYEGEPARVTKRRPSRALIHAQCRQCQPGDRTDCEAEDCALYPYRPWSGPGHAPGRRASPAQEAAAARGRETMRQGASTPVGAALDA